MAQKKASESSQRPGSQEVPESPPSVLTHTLTLLSSKDDTSRLMGLAMLKSILNNQIIIQENSEILKECWDAISAKFLDQLLKPATRKEQDEDSSRNTIELAVAIVHAFLVLLPDYVKSSKKAIGRISGLIGALIGGICLPCISSTRVKSWSVRKYRRYQYKDTANSSHACKHSTGINCAVML